MGINKVIGNFVMDVDIKTSEIMCNKYMLDRNLALDDTKWYKYICNKKNGASILAVFANYQHTIIQIDSWYIIYKQIQTYIANW